MDLLIKHDICPLINNGFLLVFVTTTCCICFLPNMSIGQTGKQPAQFCPWLFWQKTCPQMAKYKVMATIMVITIDYLAARTKRCGIVRSILWLRVHQIYSKKEKGHISAAGGFVCCWQWRWFRAWVIPELSNSILELVLITGIPTLNLSCPIPELSKCQLCLEDIYKEFGHVQRRTTWFVAT